MLTRLAGGTVHDPTSGEDGVVRDVFVDGDRIVADPGPGARVERTVDVAGGVVMAGAIDVHSHIAGGNVNNARLLLPDIQRGLLAGSLAGREGLPFGQTRWAAPGTGYRYAEMGYTTVVEPAMLPLNARAAHLELAAVPIIDKAALAVLGNDHFLVSWLREGAAREALRDYVAWTVKASQALGVKVINAGGALAFRRNARKLDLDDEVPGYGVTSRAILRALLRAVHDTGIAHPLHVHCNNLGLAGNVSTALATIGAAEGLPMHLAHVQFYGYGAEGRRGFSSGARALAEAVNAHPNVTVDVGQVMFGQTATISADVLRQHDARRFARPRKWILSEADGGGGGIVPVRYSRRSYVNALQWAIGLELFLLIEDPWRVFFTTDHPNGAPFTSYPRLAKLLMRRDYREEWLAQVPSAARRMMLLPEIEREYTLQELAIMTRAAPARLLGLADRGHLRPGALADVAVYRRHQDPEVMLGHVWHLFKDGVHVIARGRIATAPPGRALVVRPDHDRAVEQRLTRYFDERHGLALRHLEVAPDAIRGEEHFRAQAIG